jgi:hypothetical protein
MGTKMECWKETKCGLEGVWGGRGPSSRGALAAAPTQKRLHVPIERARCRRGVRWRQRPLKKRLHVPIERARCVTDHTKTESNPFMRSESRGWSEAHLVKSTVTYTTSNQASRDMLNSNKEQGTPL